jgi:hypothetical protein
MYLCRPTSAWRQRSGDPGHGSMGKGQILVNGHSAGICVKSLQGSGKAMSVHHNTLTGFVSC